ncbi:MAG: group III truncated hemoglobin [Thiomonas sp.]
MRQSLDAATAAAAPLERRAALAAALQRRTGLDDAVLRRLVESFYAQARLDPDLGPIFAAHVVDWSAHYAVMVDFWASVALLAGRYHRNALRAHKPLGLRSEHFDRWLMLFDATLQQPVTPQARKHLLDIARRIAGTLRQRLCPAALPTQQTGGLHAITNDTPAAGST